MVTCQTAHADISAQTGDFPIEAPTRMRFTQANDVSQPEFHNHRTRRPLMLWNTGPGRNSAAPPSRWIIIPILRQDQHYGSRAPEGGYEIAQHPGRPGPEPAGSDPMGTTPVLCDFREHEPSNVTSYGPWAPASRHHHRAGEKTRWEPTAPVTSPLSHAVRSSPPQYGRLPRQRPEP